MSKKLETRLLVGVIHKEKFATQVIEALDSKFPEGFSSIMLEKYGDKEKWTLAQSRDYLNEKNCEFRILNGLETLNEGMWKGTEFFDCLEKYAVRIGSKIICGDISFVDVKKFLERDRLKNSVRYFNGGLIKKIKIGICSIQIFPEEYLSKKVYLRNMYMLRMMRREKPQIVVLGRYHTDYLKKKHPEIPYLAFVDPKIERFVKPPHRPDEVIELR